MNCLPAEAYAKAKEYLKDDGLFLQLLTENQEPAETEGDHKLHFADFSKVSDEEQIRSVFNALREHDLLANADDSDDSYSSGDGEDGAILSDDYDNSDSDVPSDSTSEDEEEEEEEAEAGGRLNLFTWQGR